MFTNQIKFACPRKMLIDVIAVTLTMYLFWSVSHALLPVYFSPGYLVEFRSFATIETAIAFQQGINPYQLSEPNGTTNVYSVIWPLLIAKIGDILNITSAEGLRHIAFSINLASLVSVISGLAIFGLQRKVNPTLLSSMVIFALFANLITFNLGEWPYGTGLNLCILGLLLGLNASNSYLKLFFSSVLLFLASLLKIYFVICAAPLLISSYFFARKSKKNLLKLFYLAFFFISVVLILDFLYPTYFAHVIGLHQLFTDLGYSMDHEASGIFRNYAWYYLILIFFAHNITLKKHPIESITQFIGIIAIFIFVTFVMGRHIGNYIAYTIHIMSPLLIYSLALLKSEDDRRLAGISVLFFIAASWIFMPPLNFGILDQKTIIENEKTIDHVKAIIDELESKDLYISPVLATLAHNKTYVYVDAGNREYIAEWEIKKKAFNDNWIYSSLGWGNLTLKDYHFKQYYKTATYAICTRRCPTAESGLIDTNKKIGKVTTARGQISTVRLFSRQSEAPHPAM